MKTYIEIEVDIEYDYSPAVKATHIDPPEHEELLITSVTLNGLDIFAHLEDDHVTQLTDAALEEVHNPDPPEPDNYG